MNQPTEERSTSAARQWVCSVCSLVLKEEPGEQVLGRIPVTRMSQTELTAAREREAAEKAARVAEQAARSAEVRAAAMAKRSAMAPNPDPRPWEQAGGIELQEMPASEFVLEMGGEEKVIGQPAPAAVPPPSLAQPPMPAIAQPFMAPPAPMMQPPAPAGPQVPTWAATAFELFERVLVAEDTVLVREIVKDALVQHGISQHVRGCANGEEFLQVIAESVAAGVAVDLAILDVDMPILNGYFAAIALRAMERGLRARPTPIVFFTAYPCDDTFKKVLEHCQPARYLNKGADASPPRIAGRLVQVLASLKR